MRIFNLSLLVASVALVVSGCATTNNTEKKFGRGINNLTEFSRGGEISRSVEQSTLFRPSSVAAPTGFIHGVNRSIGRTFVGVYEIITAPFPPYDPVMKPVQSVYPDSYHPSIPATSIMQTDTHLGFTGGDVAPWSPGSRFTIFDN